MTPWRAATLLVAGCVWAAFATGCKPKPFESAPSDEDRAVSELESAEKLIRATIDFARQPSSDRVLGADPYVIAALPAGAQNGDARFAGLLRNADRVVILDARLRELGRAETPPLSSALGVTSDGEILAGGEGSSAVFRYRWTGERLSHVSNLDLEGGSATRQIRALAVHDQGAVFVVDEVADQLLVVGEGSNAPHVIAVAPGPFRLALTHRFAIVASLIGHAISVFRLDEYGIPVGAPMIVHHDGPIWSVAAIERGSELLVAAGGVEDHPLDRTGGSFGFVDSYLYLYRFGNVDAVTRLASLNVGERGVVTPKALAFEGDGLKLVVTGYGAPRALELTWDKSDSASDYAATPRESSFYVPPGTASLVSVDASTLAIANPLLDAWVLASPDRVTLVRVDPGKASSPRGDESRVGEALFFTTLMSPWAKTDGELSRFTCETCHFEGTVDGRTHATGRGHVSATTRPLLGLFNNAPHFSRALDPDTSEMVDAEFRVASQNTGHSPWFSLDQASADPTSFAGAPVASRERSWLDDMVNDPDAIDGSPEGLRRAFIQFLCDSSPRPNPAVLGRHGFSSEEAEGAQIFSKRCASCHAARLSTNDPRSLVPFPQWEAAIFGNPEPTREQVTRRKPTPGVIVWARDGYEKTGIEPYVHAEGARPPSLRRLSKKRPYFTNGSAKTLQEVLGRVRFSEKAFMHDAGATAPDDMLRLEPQEQAALLAFLRLL